MWITKETSSITLDMIIMHQQYPYKWEELSQVITSYQKMQEEEDDILAIISIIQNKRKVTTVVVVVVSHLRQSYLEHTTPATPKTSGISHVIVDS